MMERISGLLICAVLMGCGSEAPDDPCGRTYCLDFQWISHSPLFSAYDGVHAYSIAPYIPAAVQAAFSNDPVVASSVKWQVDAAYVAESEFPELPASIKLTTKRAGTTTVKFSGKSLSGESVNSEAQLTISEARADEWDDGEERFQAGMAGDGLPTMPAAPGEGTCGMPVTITMPDIYPCAGCHDEANSAAPGFAPIHAEGYSDSQLIEIITEGAKPAGSTFESAALRDTPNPDCIFAQTHAWRLSEPEKQGLLWKVRSLPPSAEVLPPPAAPEQ